jgi:hypothetical protein
MGHFVRTILRSGGFLASSKWHTQMSASLLVFLLQRIVLSVFTLAMPHSMPQDGNLISEIGNLFGEVLRELNGEEPEQAAPVRAMVAIEAPQRKLLRGEADKKEHADRTLALSGAMESWVIQTCQLDEAQQTTLKELVAKHLTDENAKYAKHDNPAQQNRPFGENTPTLFAQSDGVGTKLTDALLKSIRKDILNDVQKEQLDIAVAERTESQNAAFREFVVALFDQELFLSDEQRQKMLEHFSEEKKQITSPFYSFVGQTYYLPYQSLSTKLPVGKADFLDQRQKARLADLTSGTNGNQNYIMFQSSEGPEQWAENIKKAVVTQRTTYLNAAAVRVGYFERTLNLTTEQVEYLTVASKGATTTALADWKASTQRTVDNMIEQMGQMRGNFAFSAQNISVDSLDRNEIWIEATNKFLAQYQENQFRAQYQGKDHDGQIRLAKAKTATALLDQEMWLTPKQREEVLDFTKRSLPQKSSRSTYDDYVRELVLIAYPLHKANEATVNKVLTESQLAVWKQMKGFLPLNPVNNFLEIPMKNQGGGFTVPLPD